ncbi:MAG TPA: hypothetical protein VJI96_02715 [Candidatus Andersenbacteria bacterium]|nr:hypothetical protein [Candidatus Andersenbacteria bacterium]
MAEDLYNQLVSEGFERVERDDRLLDVFPKEVREKGIELWDKWGADTIEIVRLHVPRGRKGLTRYAVPRVVIETALLSNKKLDLSIFV